MLHLYNFGKTAYGLVLEAQQIALDADRDLATTGDLLLAMVSSPSLESAAYLREFKIDATHKPHIEAQIVLANYLTPPKSGMYARELSLALHAASELPRRFGGTDTTDLQLLAALFCEMNPYTKRIFRITSEKRVAPEVLSSLGINLEQFKDRLIAKLLPVPIPRPLIMFQ